MTSPFGKHVSSPPYMPETRTRLSRRPVKTVPSTIGNVLSLSLNGAQEHPFVSLEIVQAWKDRRLQLITQDLAAGRIRDDRWIFNEQELLPSPMEDEDSWRIGRSPKPFGIANSEDSIKRQPVA